MPVIAEVEALQGTRAEILDQDIAGPDERQQQLAIACGFEI